MEKILFVSNSELYLDDLSFFYEVLKINDYIDAFDILNKNDDIIFCFLEDMDGIDDFVYLLNNSKKSINFVVGTDINDFEKVRHFFKKGAKDLVSVPFQSEKIFLILDEFKEKLENTNLEIEELKKRNEKLENEVTEYQILYETTKILRLELEFEEIISRLIQLVDGLTGGDSFFILKNYENFKYYYTENSRNINFPYMRKFLKENGLKKISEIPEKFTAFYPFKFENKIWYILPIIIKNSLKGYLIVIIEDDEIKDNVIEVMNSVLSQAGVVIENAFLIEESKNINFEMVKSLVKAIEAKDSYTKGHSRRVAEYSVLIASYMNFSSEKLRKLEMAAVLHDVGKIGLSEFILNKKEPLTQDEFEIIKEHPSKGFYILSEIRNMHEIALIVKYHHERWDGKGYPERLRGKEIPLEARIIAVCDTFDAMTSDRPYRKGLEPEKAFEEIKKNSGLQFDPFVVEIFLGIEKEKILSIMNGISKKY